MGLKPVKGRSWLDIDDHYTSDIKLKSDLIANHRDAVFATTDAAKDGSQEILELVTKELNASYPELLVSDPGADDPLLKASLMVQEDLVLMQEGAHGEYDLTAASVCFPTGWNLTEKVGKPMRAIHDPVPDLNPAIGHSIDKFFQNMKPGKIVERFNWGLYDDNALFQPNWWREQQPKKDQITRATIGSAFFFRVERQTLQRLETKNSALFTIRIFNTTLDELLSDDQRRQTLLHSLTTMPDAMRSYKTVARYEELLFEYLNSPASSSAPG